jgi:phage shock protein PspC (stress-responsive transcriptional regulator)
MRKNFFLFLIIFLAGLGITLYHIMHLITLLSHPLTEGNYGEVVIASLFTLWGIAVSISIVRLYFSPRNKRQSPDDTNDEWRLFVKHPKE